MTYGDHSWREWILTEDQSRPFLKQALDAGINFFDTANVYSYGASEVVLGNFLHDQGVKRDDVVIATKVYSEMGPGPNQKGLSRKAIFQELDASLKPAADRLHRFVPDPPVGQERPRSRRRWTP